MARPSWRCASSTAWTSPVGSRTGRWNRARPSAILAQVAGALDAAHARGLVHRDVKPGNVLLDRTAQGEHAYLTDFGLTKQTGTESGLTRMGSFMGTPAYMAPEQIEGREVDGRADQYSLACMAFELLTGSVPFTRDQEFAVAMAHVRDRPPAPTSLRPELPAAVDIVFAQAMAKDREARYSTCSAFVDDLRSALGGGAVIARPLSTEQRRRTSLLVAAVLGLGLVAVAGVALASGLLGGAGSPSPPASAPLAVAPTPAPTATSSPTPDPSIFPNTAEAALLAKLPANLTSTCVRGGGKADTAAAGWNGQIVVSRSGNAPNIVNNYGPVQPGAPKASLICTPDGGPDQLYIQELRLPSGTGDVGGEAAFSVAALATRYAIKPGSCSSGAEASTTWSVGGSSVPSGTVVCIPKAGWDGGSWIYWSFAGGNTLGFATRKDADYDALYQWWQNLTLFIE